jgi:hypothetical protein
MRLYDLYLFAADRNKDRVVHPGRANRNWDRLGIGTNQG